MFIGGHSTHFVFNVFAIYIDSFTDVALRLGRVAMRTRSPELSASGNETIMGEYEYKQHTVKVK